MISIPTSGEFRAFLRRHGLTGARAAALAGLKNSRGIRRMCADEASKYHRPVPPAVWAKLQERVKNGDHLENNFKPV